jgi:transcription initiation factor TFIIIB Brf1 subunit/transcription initiation factor TFIIB
MPMTESKFELIRSEITELNLPDVTHTACLAILNDNRTESILTDRNDKGIIAGAIYIAAIQTSNRVTQSQIADVLGISESTIYKYYVRIAKSLGLFG